MPILLNVLICFLHALVVIVCVNYTIMVFFIPDLARWIFLQGCKILTERKRVEKSVFKLSFIKKDSYI